VHAWSASRAVVEAVAAMAAMGRRNRVINSLWVVISFLRVLRRLESLVSWGMGVDAMASEMERLQEGCVRRLQ
jgi:hypothetical protein